MKNLAKILNEVYVKNRRMAFTKRAFAELKLLFSELNEEEKEIQRVFIRKDNYLFLDKIKSYDNLDFMFNDERQYFSYEEEIDILKNLPTFELENYIFDDFFEEMLREELSFLLHTKKGYIKLYEYLLKNAQKNENAKDILCKYSHCVNYCINLALFDRGEELLIDMGKKLLSYKKYENKKIA